MKVPTHESVISIEDLPRNEKARYLGRELWGVSESVSLMPSHIEAVKDVVFQADVTQVAIGQAISAPVRIRMTGPGVMRLDKSYIAFDVGLLASDNNNKEAFSASNLSFINSIDVWLGSQLLESYQNVAEFLAPVDFLACHYRADETLSYIHGQYITPHRGVHNHRAYEQRSGNLYGRRETVLINLKQLPCFSSRRQVLFPVGAWPYVELVIRFQPSQSFVIQIASAEEAELPAIHSNDRKSVFENRFTLPRIIANMIYLTPEHQEAVALYTIERPLICHAVNYTIEHLTKDELANGRSKTLYLNFRSVKGVAVWLSTRAVYHDILATQNEPNKGINALDTIYCPRFPNGVEFKLLIGGRDVAVPLVHDNLSKKIENSRHLVKTIFDHLIPSKQLFTTELDFFLGDSDLSNAADNAPPYTLADGGPTVQEMLGAADSLFTHPNARNASGISRVTEVWKRFGRRNNAADALFGLRGLSRPGQSVYMQYFDLTSDDNFALSGRELTGQSLTLEWTAPTVGADADNFGYTANNSIPFRVYIAVLYDQIYSITANDIVKY